ncbi:MAG: hypothetical protein Q9213_007291 [Squamulea squamosa]
MAEAIGLAGSIAALIHVARRSCEYLNDVKDSSKERTKFLNEVSNILNLLLSLQNLLKTFSSDPSWSPDLRALDTENGPLDRLRSGLEEFTKEFEKEPSAENIRHTIKWPFKKKNKLSQSIKDNVTGMPTAMQLIRNIANTTDALRHIEDEWIEEGSGEVVNTLFLTGMPGAGKSVLAARVHKYLHEHIKSRKIGVAGIYLNYKEEHSQTPDNVLAAIWEQLIDHDRPLTMDVQTLHKEHAQHGTRPTYQEIQTIIKQETSRYDKLYIVMDALDEVSATRRAALLASMNDLSPKLIVMSRPIDNNTLDKWTALAPLVHLEVQASSDDLRTYLRSRIKAQHHLQNFVAKVEDLEDQIITTIVSKAQNMFLPAKLYIDSVGNKTSPGAVRRSLGSLPDDLTDIYTAALARIGDQSEEHRSLAHRILEWVTFAKQPLSLRSLQYALAIESGQTEFDEELMPDKEIMFNVCAGLIVHDTQSDVVRLVHHTAQEHFVAKNRFPDAHSNITKTCLTYLSYEALQSDGPDKRELNIKDHPLLPYVSFFWGVHAVASPEAMAEDEVIKFLASDPRVHLGREEDYIMYLDGLSTVFIGSVPGFSTAAFFGLLGTMLRLKPDVHEVDEISFRGWSVLHLSVHNRQTGVVEQLLKWGATVDCWDRHKENTPLFLAIKQNDCRMMESLLLHGADPNLQNKLGESPLIVAVFFADTRTMRKLLGVAVELNAQENTGKTALHWSVLLQNIEHLVLLLEHGASPEIMDYNGDPNMVFGSAFSELSRLDTEDPRWGRHLLQDEVGRLRFHLYNYSTLRDMMDSLFVSSLMAIRLNMTHPQLTSGAQPLWERSLFVRPEDEAIPKLDRLQQVMVPLLVPSNNVEMLSKLVTLEGQSPVFFCEGGMTALDHAVCLGSQPLIDVLTTHTTITTSVLQMTLEEYLKKYIPETTELSGSLVGDETISYFGERRCELIRAMNTTQAEWNLMIDYLKELEKDLM